MTSPTAYDVAIIGAGPGGYVAAIRAGQLGLKTAIIERDELGGLCLNWGCIPSKALLRNAEIVSLFKRANEFGVSFDNLTISYPKAIRRSRNVVAKMVKGVEYLLRKNGVDQFKGTARFVSPQTLHVRPSDQLINAKNVIIATGARPKSIPSLPIDGNFVITSRQALEQTTLPSSVVIVGGGPVGVEFASIYSAYGVQVTMVETLPRLLPYEDEEISRRLERSFSKRGIKIMTGSEIVGVTRYHLGPALQVEQAAEDVEIHCDKTLVAVGVLGNVEGIGLEAIGIRPASGFIPVDDGMATSAPGVYAIGDVTGKLLLAHVASAQAVHVVEAIAGRNPEPLNYLDVPKAIYSSPQVAGFGLTEAQANERGHDVKVGRFPYQANGKATAMGDTEGLVKLVTDAAYGEILGVHMIGSDVTELLPELSMTRMLEGGVTEMGRMVHAHPTLSEALKEAALDAQGEAIHI